MEPNPYEEDVSRDCFTLWRAEGFSRSLENIVISDHKKIYIYMCPNLDINTMDLDFGPDPDSPNGPEADPDERGSRSQSAEILNQCLTKHYRESKSIVYTFKFVINYFVL